MIEPNDFFLLDKATGKLFWKNVSKYHIGLTGKEAGGPCESRNKKSYWVVSVNGKKYKRGRIVFYMVNGFWPSPCIDHINGQSLDDRPQNLRQATLTENAWNHKTRKRRINLPMGVRSLASGKYQARISYKGKQIHLGAYSSPQEAADVYMKERKSLYGQFA